MREYSESVDILVAPERIWAVMLEVQRWPEWTPTMLRVRLLEGTPIQRGMRVEILQPKSRPMVWTVTDVVEGRSFVWTTKLPGIRVEARHIIAPVPGGSRVTLGVKYSGLLGGLAGGLTRKMNERFLAQEAQGLKQRCEAA